MYLAGRKQHYIPQSLLRGFEAFHSGKKSQVVVYKKGMAPYVTSIEGVAAQRDFYSGVSVDDTDTLDDLITSFESARLNPILIELRGVKSGPIDAELAAIAVVHLSIRAAHVRGAFAQIAQSVLGQLENILQDHEATREYAGIDSLEPDSLLRRQITSDLDALLSLDLAAKDKAALERIIHFRAREKFADFMPTSVPLLRVFLDRLQEGFPSTVERAHLSALERSLVPAARVSALKALRWNVFSVHDPHYFVLPDCLAVVGEDASLENLKPYSSSSIDEVFLVAMPISSKQLLIGSRDGTLPDPGMLNQEFAKCSFEFFVSSRVDQIWDDLAKHIGANVTAGTESLIKESNKSVESVADVADDPKRDDVSSFQVSIQVPPETPRGAEIEAALRHLFAAQCGALEAERLHSLVVTADVANSVSKLRGRPLTPKEAQESTQGSVEFIQTDAYSALQMLVPTHIAALLLENPSTQEQLFATYVVKHNLGRVTYTDLWIRKYAQLASFRNLAAQDRLGVEFMFRFSSHYFGAHVATSAVGAVDLDNANSHFAKVALSTISALSTIRNQFVSHRNIDRLALDAFAFVDVFLITSASLCGMHASKGTSPSQSSELGNLLAQNGLWDWFRLFERDLRRHFETCRRPSAPLDGVLLLGQHAERILWQFGIFLSETTMGQLWIDVSDDMQLGTIRQTLRA